MSEAIKTIQTLYSNSKISLIILKRNLTYVCFEKMHVYIYKVSYCDKGEMKVKNFEADNRLEAITLIGIVLGGRYRGSFVLVVNYPRRKLSGVQFSQVGIVRGDNCLGDNCLGVGPLSGEQLF